MCELTSFVFTVGASTMLAMNADEKFKSKLEEAEKELLEDKVSKLNDDTRKSIYDQVSFT